MKNPKFLNEGFHYVKKKSIFESSQSRISRITNHDFEDDNKTQIKYFISHFKIKVFSQLQYEIKFKIFIFLISIAFIFCNVILDSYFNFVSISIVGLILNLLDWMNFLFISPLYQTNLVYVSWAIELNLYQILAEWGIFFILLYFNETVAKATLIYNFSFWLFHQLCVS